jgi:hypothetical protein
MLQRCYLLFVHEPDVSLLGTATVDTIEHCLVSIATNFVAVVASRVSAHDLLFSGIEVPLAAITFHRDSILLSDAWINYTSGLEG